MPNVWTHLIYGQEVLKRVGRADWLGTEPNRHLFHYGCQGPDPLFYHNFLPWRKDKRASALGSAMHEEHCGAFLHRMFRYLRGAGGEDPALVYAVGFLLHHVLDRNMHPYIFVKSGFKKWDHQRFEVIVDTLTAYRLRGIETWKVPVCREFELTEGLPSEIVRLFHELATEFYPELYDDLGPGLWREAYRDMYSAQKLFHDPTGIKRMLTLGRIEPFVYKRKNADLDYLNEGRKPWIDPCVEGTTHAESFQDLWERALEDGEHTLEQVFRYLSVAQDPPGPEEAEAERELARRIGNVSYSTGRPCDSGAAIRFVDPIL